MVDVGSKVRISGISGFRAGTRRRHVGPSISLPLIGSVELFLTLLPPPARMSLLSDSEGEQDDLNLLTINEHYAKAFEYKKERQELEKRASEHLREWFPR